LGSARSTASFLKSLLRAILLFSAQSVIAFFSALFSFFLLASATNLPCDPWRWQDGGGRGDSDGGIVEDFMVVMATV
jgi:hypothetical protein